MASFANIMGGEILGFAVVCFMLFFVNGVRLKLYNLEFCVLFCFSWKVHLFEVVVSFFPCLLS